jgi:hypothetical protein
MENEQKGQQANQEQQSQGEPNPTLNQPGTQVADYGNVTGGSASGNVEQEQQGRSNEQSGSRSGNNDTMGNP